MDFKTLKDTSTDKLEDIITELQNYDIFDFLSKVSALNLLPHNQNKCIVLAQEAHIGRDMESAIKHMEIVRNERLEKNRKLDADLTVKEKEIIDNIKKAKAGSL